MAEMKDPKEFLKSLLCAETIIIIVYLIFGIVVYSQQGQFTINPASQGISIYSLQTLCNVCGLFGALVAAGLYSNVGLKVIYSSLIIDILDGPLLTSKKGRQLWVVLVIAYWSLAFLISASIPNINNISGQC